MGDGRDSGANISRRAGEGEAIILNWNSLHNNLNQLYQRDIQQSKAIQDDYRKSSIKMGDAGSGIRPADIPKSQELYGNYRNASLALMDKKVINNPEQRAYYMQKQNDAYTGYLNHAEQSKDAKKFQHSIVTDRLQTNGINRIPQEEYEAKNHLYDNLPLGEIGKQRLNDISSWTVPADDTPKNNEAQQYGGTIAERKEDPVYNGKDITGWNVSSVTRYKANPLDAATYAIKSLHSRTLTAQAVDDFKNTDPQQSKDIIDQANRILQSTSGMPHENLPYDEKGLYAAKAALKAGAPIGEGSNLGFKENPEYRRTQMMAERKEMAEFTANLSKGVQKELIRFRKSLGGAATGETDAAAATMYNSALSNDAEGVMSAGAELTKNTGGKVLPVSRATILDATYNQKLIEELQLDIPGVQSFTTGKGETAISSRNRYIKQFTEAVQRKTGVKLNENDLNTTIIPLSIKRESKPQKDLNGALTGESQVVISATAFNPKAETPKTYQSAESGLQKGVPKYLRGKGGAAPAKEAKGKSKQPSYKGLDKNGNPIFE